MHILTHGLYRWQDWLREAKAVARGYPDAPGGTELGKLSIIKDQICASKFPEALAARVEQRAKKEAARANTVGAARSRGGRADPQPARRAVSARRPHFVDEKSKGPDGAQGVAEPSTRLPGTPVSKMLQSGRMLKRRLESVRSPQPGEPLSPPARRRPSPTTSVQASDRQLVPAAVQHPVYVSDSGGGVRVAQEEDEEDEPSGTIAS